MNLKKYLEDNNLGLRAFSEMADLNPSTISSYFSGKRGISLTNAYKINIATKGEVQPKDLISSDIKDSIIKKYNERA